MKTRLLFVLVLILAAGCKKDEGPEYGKSKNFTCNISDDEGIFEQWDDELEQQIANDKTFPDTAFFDDSIVVGVTSRIINTPGGSKFFVYPSNKYRAHLEICGDKYMVNLSKGVNNVVAKTDSIFISMNDLSKDPQGCWRLYYALEVDSPGDLIVTKGHFDLTVQ